MTSEMTTDVQPQAHQPSLLVRMLAELAGTFALALTSIGVAVFAGVSSNDPGLYTATAFGLMLAVLMAALGPVSGGHLNPLVSLGAAIIGKLKWTDVAPYIAAQLIGGMAGVGLLRMVIPDTLAVALQLADVKALLATAAAGFGINSPLGNMSGGAVTVSTADALVILAVACAIFVGVTLAAMKTRKSTAPWVVGGVSTALLFLLTHLTGSGLNPAIVTGVALFSAPWALQQLWLFWAAPVVGAVLISAVIAAASPAVVEEWDDDESDEYDDDEYDEDDDSDNEADEFEDEDDGFEDEDDDELDESDPGTFAVDRPSPPTT